MSLKHQQSVIDDQNMEIEVCKDVFDKCLLLVLVGRLLILKHMFCQKEPSYTNPKLRPYMNCLSGV